MKTTEPSGKITANEARELLKKTISEKNAKIVAGILAPIYHRIRERIADEKSELYVHGPINNLALDELEKVDKYKIEGVEGTSDFYIKW